MFHLHLCVCQILLPKVSYSVFKLYVFQVCAFPGNLAYGLAIAMPCRAELSIFCCLFVLFLKTRLCEMGLLRVQYFSCSLLFSQGS